MKHKVITRSSAVLFVFIALMCAVANGQAAGLAVAELWRSRQEAKHPLHHGR